MQKLFNKILVPVDFSKKSKRAVSKAVEIATWYNCSIQLLYVINISAFNNTQPIPHPKLTFDFNADKDWIECELKKICKEVTDTSKTLLDIHYTITTGSWNESIIEFVNENAFDLVVIGQDESFFKKRKMKLKPDRIAIRTAVPVITVPENKGLIRLCSILIPVTDFLPVRKLMYAIYMASNNETTIKLLGIENEHTKEKMDYYIKKAYSLVREHCNVNIELEVVKADNIADAVNHFAMARTADLIILNPGVETKMPGFFSKILGNVIQKYSIPPVLTVSPQQ